MNNAVEHFDWGVELSDIGVAFFDMVVGLFDNAVGYSDNGVRYFDVAVEYFDAVGYFDMRLSNSLLKLRPLQRLLSGISMKYISIS